MTQSGKDDFVCRVSPAGLLSRLPQQRICDLPIPRSLTAVPFPGHSAPGARPFPAAGGAAPRRPARRDGGNQHGHPHRATCAGKAGRPPGPRAGRHTMGAAGLRAPLPPGPTGAAAAAPGWRCRHSHSARHPLPRPGPCERALLAGLPGQPPPVCPAARGPAAPSPIAAGGAAFSTRRKRIRMRWEEGKGKAGGRRERGTHRLHRRHLRALGSRTLRGAGRGRVKAPGGTRLAARWSRAPGGRLGRAASREM